MLKAEGRSLKESVMSQYLVDRGFAALSLITTLLLCACSSPKLAVEGNPMPEKQVANYMTSVTPSSAYDTPPKFLKGYAPFFSWDGIQKASLGLCRCRVQRHSRWRDQRYSPHNSHSLFICKGSNPCRAKLA